MIPGEDPSPAVGRSSVTDVATLLGQHGDSSYREFLAVPALSMGMFVASPGDADQQDPHDRDEVYVILAGEAVLDIAGLPHAVSAGSIIYVPAGVQHHFAEILADLRALVLFGGRVR